MTHLAPNTDFIPQSIQNLPDDLKARIQWGVKAVRSQISYFEEHLGNVESSFKPDNTRVTTADVAISEALVAQLKERFPMDAFCSEEGGDEVLEAGEGFAWVFDPIDGTNNYAAGVPLCCISVALLKDGMPVYGFVYESLKKGFIQGGPSAGVWYNEEQIEPDMSAFSHRDYIGIKSPAPKEYTEKFLPIMDQYRFRSLGSDALSLAYVAIGKLSGALHFNDKVWDIAASYAFSEALGYPFKFITEPVFPLKSFSAKDSPMIHYYTGTPACVKFIEGYIS